LRDPQWRDQLAAEILAVADRRAVPPLLLATVVYAESSFIPSSTGEKNEKGLTQVHGEAAQDCDLKTTVGQLDCGARWLAEMRHGAICSSNNQPWLCALQRYQGGDKYDSNQARRGARYRLVLWLSLEERAEHNDWNVEVTYGRAGYQTERHRGGRGRTERAH
jgi:hypothetical protein